MKGKDYINARIIRDVFRKSGLTQKEFCTKCSISVSALQKYINFEIEPRPNTVAKIEKIFSEQTSFNF